IEVNSLSFITEGGEEKMEIHQAKGWCPPVINNDQSLKNKSFCKIIGVVRKTTISTDNAGENEIIDESTSVTHVFSTPEANLFARTDKKTLLNPFDDTSSEKPGTCSSAPSAPLRTHTHPHSTTKMWREYPAKASPKNMPGHAGIDMTWKESWRCHGMGWQARKTCLATVGSTGIDMTWKAAGIYMTWKGKPEKHAWPRSVRNTQQYPTTIKSISRKSLADIFQDNNKMHLQNSVTVIKATLGQKGVAEKFGLEGSEERIILNGIQGTSELNSRRVNTQQKVNLVDVKSKWPHLKEIDIPEASSCDVSLLIGGDCLDIILPIETRCGPRGTPVGIRTKLGWTITGPLPGYIRTSQGIFHTYVCSPDEELHNQVKSWWRTEEFGCKYDVETQRSVEDENAMRILEETTKKVDGRYEVPLLWKKNGGSMQNNRTVAEHHLALLERRLQRDPNLAEAYKETIHSDLEKGYVKRVVLNEAPFLVRAKILLQRVWQLGLAWDDHLPQDLLEEWQLWEAKLLMIREFSVPRFHRQVDEYPGDIEVHIFGDASELAFCSHNCTALDAWDSTRHPSFIANRLSEILDATEASQRHYCPSKLNPADDGTRGLPVLSITTSSQWLTGPEFLLLDESQWPEDVTNRVVNDNIPVAVTESDVQFTGKTTAQSEPTFDEDDIIRKAFKRYICLFTCLVTRAVHLEVAFSLETDSLIMYLQRFVARRGNPQVIYLDNGKNFDVLV
ncbi:PREDICTED: uncharacterized protein LOC107341021, partial [Paramuricea clavata]